IAPMRVKEVAELTEEHPLIFEAWLEIEAKNGPRGLLRIVRRAGTWRASDVARMIAERFPPSAELAHDLLETALDNADRGEWDDSGLEHQVLYSVPSMLAHAEVAPVFDLIDEASALFAWIWEVGPGCRDCVEDAELRVIDSALRAYRAA